MTQIDVQTVIDERPVGGVDHDRRAGELDDAVRRRAVASAGRRPRAGESSVFRLRGTAHKVVLAGHVLASVGWFGAALVVAFCGVLAGATGDASLPVPLYRVMEACVPLTMGLGVAAALSGAVLSLGTRWGFVRHWWMVAKLVITLVVFVTDPLVVMPTVRDAVASGAGDPYGPTIAHCVMLTAATVLSVLKPRGRTRRGARVLARAA